MSPRFHTHRLSDRRAAVVVLTALLMVFLVGMVAFAVDLGYMMIVNSQSQNVADAAALAGAAFLSTDTGEADTEARRFAALNRIGDRNVDPDWVETEYGTWDSSARAFTAGGPGNAVRVSVARQDVPLFFAPVLGVRNFDTGASAVAMSNPRDIAFVIDLSGSMNNDTEPCWATNEIDLVFGPEGYPTVAEDLMQQVYSDFGYGEFPGAAAHVGQPLGVAQDQYAYAEMTKNNGPLTNAAIPATYRVSNTDNESTRRQKAYKWIIDNQLASLMPAATPAPNSATNYAYWARYLDFVMRSQQITSSSPKGRPRPSYSVTLPPNQSSDRITSYGNPYTDAFPDASSNTPSGYRNQLGYRTYVQFMMDFGRDKEPVEGQKTPLSAESADCPWHDEVTEGGTFSFPPREQPTHASRRALIAAIQVIKERNQGIGNVNERDWVSVLAFDRASGVSVLVDLTSDYTAAMEACARLQAVADDSLSTATENGLVAAKQLLRSTDEGGSGRRHTNKVVVLLTDGIPNLYSSNPSEIDAFVSDHPSDNFTGDDPQDAALMQCADMQLKRWQVFPVGIGLGTNYDFMDRAARQGGTADGEGQGSRGSGNPAEYEERLMDIFRNIISNPKVRLVQ